MKISAGPYALEIPPNGVAILYETDEVGAERRLPGGVGYFEALIQFAGEVLRLNAENVALRERLHDQNAISVTLENAHAATRMARDDTLEEATAVCLRKARDHVIPIGQDNYHDGCISCAAAIRALKDKRDD